jgi:hypothetical protein
VFVSLSIPTTTTSAIMIFFGLVGSPIKKVQCSQRAGEREVYVERESEPKPCGSVWGGGGRGKASQAHEVLQPFQHPNNNRKRKKNQIVQSFTEKEEEDENQTHSSPTRLQHAHTDIRLFLVGASFSVIVIWVRVLIHLMSTGTRMIFYPRMALVPDLNRDGYGTGIFFYSRVIR